VQITAAVLLLVGAGLFFENTRSALDQRVHYDTSRLAAARVLWTPPTSVSEAEWMATVDKVRAMTALERARYEATLRAAVHARREAFFSTLLEQTRALPGVEAAALTNTLPGSTAPRPSGGPGALQAAARPDLVSGRPPNLNASWISVSPGFLETIGVRLLQGRGIQPADAHGAPLVAVLSRSAADGLWPNEDPIGKRIHCCQQLYETLTVVGVAGDPVSSSDRSAWTRHSNFVLLSSAQTGNNARLIVVRTAHPAGQVDALRALIHGLDPRVPVFDAGPVDEFLLAGVAIARAQRVVTMALGVLALGIATFGIYGVVGYFVSRRTREFGLRLALGATPRQILRLVVDYAIHIILIGLLPAVLLASLGTRLFEHRLSGIMPNGITMWVVGAPRLASRSQCDAPRVVTRLRPGGALDCPPEQTLVLANLQTRLKRLDRTTQERLIHWRYAVCDTGMRTWVVSEQSRRASVPFPAAGLGSRGTFILTAGQEDAAAGG
jgi:hypothetical protein